MFFKVQDHTYSNVCLFQRIRQYLDSLLRTFICFRIVNLQFNFRHLGKYLITWCQALFEVSLNRKKTVFFYRSFLLIFCRYFAKRKYTSLSWHIVNLNLSYDEDRVTRWWKKTLNKYINNHMNERIRGEQENHIKITLKSCFAVIKFSSEIVYTCNASPCNFINRKKITVYRI